MCVSIIGNWTISNFSEINLYCGEKFSSKNQAMFDEDGGGGGGGGGNGAVSLDDSITLTEELKNIQNHIKLTKYVF